MGRIALVSVPEGQLGGQDVHKVPANLNVTRGRMVSACSLMGFEPSTYIAGRS